MRKKYLLGLDYGTGSAKACIIDEDAKVLTYANKEYPIITEKPGWSEHDASKYWEICGYLIKKCINNIKIDSKDIVSVAVSSAVPAMVMVDSLGNPINNAYNLMDRRATKQIDDVRNLLGEDKIFEITANRLEDQPILISLLWEKENRPEDFKRIKKVLTIDGFITYKLTGNYTVHYSAAAFFNPSYDIRKKKFDKGMLDTLGLDEALLPTLCKCTDVAGKVTKTAAADSGLFEGTIVAGGQLDCNAGWIGAGATEPGEIQMNLGTCGNFGIIHKDDDFFDSMIACEYTVDDTYITVPTTTTGGQALRYVRDNFSHAEVAAEELTGLDTYQMLNLQAEKIKPGSDGLIVLPYLMGERTPIWDINARGVIFGLSLMHKKAHVVRAVMESVAYALYDSFRLIKDSGKKMEYPIILNEGGAKSKLWREIITDVFNVPTAMVKNRVGAPYGDAILAGVVCGLFEDFSIAKEKAEYIEQMEPNIENNEIYMEAFSIYKNVYNHLKNDFIDLRNFRNRI